MLTPGTSATQAWIVPFPCFEWSLLTVLCWFISEALRSYSVRHSFHKFHNSVGGAHADNLHNWKLQGLPPAQLQSVVCYTTCVLYAPPDRRWYLNAANIDCWQQLSDKVKRWQIVTNNYDASQLYINSNMALFRSSLNVNHCLRHLYPDKRHHVRSMTLRPRGHDFSLPKYRLQCIRNSFINRKLFAYL